MILKEQSRNSLKIPLNMETLKPEYDEDSDIIMVNNPPETISLVGSSPEKRDKTKKQRKRKKARKRMVQLGVDHVNHTETLHITQKLKVKKTKFQCIIDISNVESKKCPKKAKKANSMKRFSQNQYKLPTKYERIVPICSRSDCLHLKKDKRSKLSCCKSKNNKARIRENRERIRLSPISSLPLSEDEHNITYEEISAGEFPDSSEDELDTLIKRTKERERKFIKQFSLSSLLYTSSPLHTNEEIGSAHSNASTHSKATLVLTPEIGAYSPYTSPNYVQDTRQKEKSQIGSNVENLYNPAHPTDTPPRTDFMKVYDQESTAEFNALEDNGRPNLRFIKTERHDSFSESCTVKTEMVESADCNSVTDTQEINLKRESGVDFPNSEHVQPGNTEYIIVKRESASEVPGFVKLENVEVTNYNSAIKTEEILVKREQRSDVNGNFDADWSY